MRRVHGDATGITSVAIFPYFLTVAGHAGQCPRSPWANAPANERVESLLAYTQDTGGG